MTKTTNVYVVATNGLSGRCQYQASDPDEALMYAHRHERFLRLIKQHPEMPPTKVMQIAKDECYMPDFRIESCILEKSD